MFITRYFTLFLLTITYALQLNAQSGILSSQVGYDTNEVKKIFIRSDQAHFIKEKTAFKIVNIQNGKTFKGQVKKWGSKWNATWWIADFSKLKKEGSYQLLLQNAKGQSLSSDTFKIGDHILWKNSYNVIAHDLLDQRAREARVGKGWRDCGSDLQEFSSHAVTIDGLGDILENSDKVLSKEEHEYLRNQLVRGCDFLAYLQDKAKEIKLGDGAVIHEDRQDHVVTGNVAKAAKMFAKSSRLLRGYNDSKSKEYEMRAKKAFQWIHQNGPVVNEEEQLFYASVHGAPKGAVPPAKQWMTRDLVTMISAAIELYDLGNTEYKALAINYADKVMARQVSKQDNEDGLYGHFYTYSDYSQFGGVKFTEKANIHCGAHSKDGRMYNKGGHYPHYILPFIKMIEEWGSDAKAKEWRSTVSNFAYGYFIPACGQSPFMILPSGFYKDQGLLYFGSWYHGHNNIYSFAATLALVFEKFFKDDQFRSIAVGNIQWIAGLNCGLKEKDSPGYLSYSMISGIGNRYRGSWTNIAGSICNGFSASPQFKITEPSLAKDLPVYFDDEDYIAHTFPFLSALIRFQK
ncbi:hypothetical protein EYV94_21250 [Puteibacter caeruleilacunae]|nr:hypothetical protein EYV94_21250 [Puteibacter caeruleilacunae]